MRQIRHKSTRLHSQTIHRGRCRDVQRAIVLVSPREIGGLFGNDDCSQMVSLRVPYPDAFGARHKKISLFVNFDAVRYAVIFSTRLFPEYAAIRERSVARDIVYMPAVERDAILSQLELRRITTNTVGSLQELQTQLQTVRRSGYACDLEEHELHIRCAAAPIWDHTGAVNASLSITAPAVRMNTGGQLGGALTASLTPWIADRFGWTASFLVAAILCALGGLAWWIVNPERMLPVHAVEETSTNLSAQKSSESSMDRSNFIAPRSS